MEDICKECKEPAKASCSCDNSLRFCLQHYAFIHKAVEGNHDPIDLDKRRKELKENFISAIRGLYKVKSQVITKSNQLIQIVQFIATKELSMLKEYIKICKKASESKELDADKMLEDYQNIEIPSLISENFMEAVLNNFLLYKNDNKIINPEIANWMNEIKIRALEFSKKIEKIKKRVQPTFNFFFEGHIAPIECLAVTADNNYIVSGSKDNTIRKWSLLDKKQEAVLNGHTNWVNSVALTSDNKYIISGSSDSTIRIWKFLEATQEAVLQEHTNIVTSIVVTSDNKWVNSVAITSDNNYIVSGSKDNTIRIWKFSEKRHEAVLQGHTEAINSIALTSDNKYIISGSKDKTIRIWNLLDARQENVLDCHLSEVHCVAVTLNNRFIISGSGDIFAKDNTIRIWNFLDNKQETVLKNDFGEVNCLALTSDSIYIIAGFFDNKIRIWDIL